MFDADDVVDAVLTVVMIVVCVAVAMVPWIAMGGI